MEIATFRIRNVLLAALLCSALSYSAWAATTNDALAKEFPFAVCAARNVSQTPYRLTPPVGPINETRSSATYCFGLTADAPVVGGPYPCSHMVPNKIEFIINQACLEEVPKSVRIATVNGATISPYYVTRIFNSSTYGILSVSRISGLPTVTPGSYINLCLVMRKGRTCSAIQDLCFGGTCVYAVFNADRTCCPTSQVTDTPSLG